MHQTITLDTGSGDSLTDVTDRVQAAVASSGVRMGACLVFVPHTTAAVTVNSALDPATLHDLVDEVRRLVPTRTDFRHIVDTPSDAAAHVKSSVIGASEVLVVANGELVLGRSQRVLFFDFDGPRSRRAMVTVLGSIEGNDG